MSGGKLLDTGIAVALLMLELGAGAPEQYGEPQTKLLLAFWVMYLCYVRAGLGCRQPASRRTLEQATLGGFRWPSARVLLQEGTHGVWLQYGYCNSSLIGLK